MAESSTLRLSGPMWSSVQDRGNTPRRDTRPYVGLIPTVPHQAAGPRMEPPVSDPIAMRTMRDAIAVPEPDDEPPVLCAGFHGLRAGGNGRSKLGPPIANSCVASLPSSTPPASRSFVATTLSESGTLSMRSFEWQVVQIPAVS